MESEGQAAGDGGGRGHRPATTDTSEAPLGRRKWPLRGLRDLRGGVCQGKDAWKRLRPACLAPRSAPGGGAWPVRARLVRPARPSSPSGPSRRTNFGPLRVLRFIVRDVSKIASHTRTPVASCAGRRCGALRPGLPPTGLPPLVPPLLSAPHTRVRILSVAATPRPRSRVPPEEGDTPRDSLPETRGSTSKCLASPGGVPLRLSHFAEFEWRGLAGLHLSPGGGQAGAARKFALVVNPIIHTSRSHAPRFQNNL